MTLYRHPHIIQYKFCIYKQLRLSNKRKKCDKSNLDVIMNSWKRFATLVDSLIYYDLRDAGRKIVPFQCNVCIYRKTTFQNFLRNLCLVE